MKIKKINVKNFTKQLLSYFYVGLTAAIVEWCSFYIFNEKLHLNIFFATGLSFLFATTVNWILGRKTTFKESAKSKEHKQDAPAVFLVSGIGLGANILFMELFVNILSLYPLLAKIISTGIVFIWNFFSRKYLIYKSYPTTNDVQRS